MPRRPQELINDWYERIDKLQRAQSASEERHKRYHHTLGWSAIVLGAIAGITLLSGTESVLLRSIAGLMGLLAAVLAGVQTFFSPAKRLGMHRAASTQLSQLRREIEALEKLPPKYLKNQTEVLLHVGERLVKIEQAVPVLKRDTLRPNEQKVGANARLL